MISVIEDRQEENSADNYAYRHNQNEQTIKQSDYEIKLYRLSELSNTAGDADPLPDKTTLDCYFPSRKTAVLLAEV